MRRHIASHAAIRGVAAVLVIGYHLREGALYLSPRLVPWLFVDRGYLWVDLFFVLSGFIITYTVAPDGAALNWADTKRFWMARATRIYPLHFFCTAMFILLWLANLFFDIRGGGPLDPLWSWPGLFRLIQEVLLVQAVNPPGFHPLNAVSWSISAEMFAYALLPVMLLVARHRWGVPLMLSLSLLFYGWILAQHRTLHIPYGLAPVRCLAAFAIGQAICLYRDYWARLSEMVINVLQFIAVFAIVAIMALPVNDVFVIAAFALLVAASWTDRGAIAAVLKTPTLQFLGEISYSIYLMHWWTLLAINFLWIHIVMKLGLPYIVQQVSWMIAVPVCAIPVAACTYRFIELPTRQHFKRRREAARVAKPATR
jgi:peptidoglycan/LPS O-acetylase OafA/YrhL